MADIDLQSLGQRLGEAITPTPRDAPQVRYATVAAVNSDGTLDVTIDGTTLRGVCATTGCVGAAEGMRCVVLRQGPLATVVGLVANADLKDINLPNNGRIYAPDSDGVVREVLQTSHGDDVSLGYGNYANSKGTTNIYGNNINLTSRGTITANQRFIEKAALPLLWSGAWYMDASQTLTLSETLTAQNHGIILVWSAYVNGAAGNYDWAYGVVPKNHHKGTGVGMPFQSAAKLGFKYVYVFDDRIVGWSNNDKTVTWNGISYDNKYWVLRQVLGF